MNRPVLYINNEDMSWNNKDHHKDEEKILYDKVKTMKGSEETARRLYQTYV